MTLRRLAEQLGQQLNLFRLPPPQAEPSRQHVLLDGQAIPYTLNQGGGRRRLALTIDERGLRVGTPRGIGRSEIEAFIHEHRGWVLQKLADIATVSRPRHLSVRDGLPLPLLGEEINIRILPGANRSRWIASTLLLEARPSANLNLLAQRALQKRALSHFSARLAHFAPQLEVAMPALGLSSARTRWGSCSSRSGIRINWRLVHLPPHLGDYVAVHELAHLHEMNHGPRFWAWVEKACPDWRRARAELKQAAVTIPIL
jgi:predicted metal-dependent hydrolase